MCADLGEDDQERVLLEVAALSGHVAACQDARVGFFRQHGIVGDERAVVVRGWTAAATAATTAALLELALEHGVASVLDNKSGAAAGDEGSHVRTALGLLVHREGSQPAQHVELGDGVPHCVERAEVIVQQEGEPGEEHVPRDAETFVGCRFDAHIQGIELLAGDLLGPTRTGSRTRAPTRTVADRQALEPRLGWDARAARVDAEVESPGCRVLDRQAAALGGEGRAEASGELFHPLGACGKPGERANGVPRRASER